MAWYEIKVTPGDKKDYAAGNRSIFIWDDRPLVDLDQARQAENSLVLKRAAFLRDVGRMEDRGQIAIVSQHIISIEDRSDWNARFPKGPSESRRAK